VLGLLVAGELLSVLVKRFLPDPTAKGLSFFAVFVLFYLVLHKRSRFGPLASLALCLLAGVTAFVGEMLWSGW